MVQPDTQSSLYRVIVFTYRFSLIHSFTSDLYLEHTWFEFWLCWLKYFLDFIIWVLDNTLKQVTDTSKFPLTHSRLIWHTKSVNTALLNNIQLTYIFLHHLIHMYWILSWMGRHYVMLLFVPVDKKLFIRVCLPGVSAKSNCMYTDTHVI
jgi:hypothetical protein